MHEVREITDGYREVMVVWWYDENDIKPNTNLIQENNGTEYE